MSQDRDKLSVFPAFFRVRGRQVVIVGSGAEALAKIRLMAETSASVVAVAPDPEPQLFAFLQEMTRSGGSVSWVDAPFDAAMLKGAVLVIAATGVPAQDGLVADAAGRHHIPVNVVDCPERCDFFIPALVNRAPVAVAIGSEGTGPVLTQLLRARIEALLNPGLGRLARFAGRYRKKAAMHLDRGRARRDFWRMFFTGAVAGAIFRGDEAAAARHALALLAESRSESDQVRFLPAGHNMVDWLTIGGQRALMQSDIIIHDGDVISDILALARRDATLLPAAPSSAATAELAADLCRKGRQVLRLVTDEARLAEEVGLLGACGIGFEVLCPPPYGGAVPASAVYPYPARRHPALRHSAGQAGEREKCSQGGTACH